MFKKLNDSKIIYSSIFYIYNDIRKLEYLSKLNINYNNIKKLKLLYKDDNKINIINILKLFKIISKIEDFGKLYTIYISQKNIDEYKLKDEYIS